MTKGVTEQSNYDLGEGEEVIKKPSHEKMRENGNQRAKLEGYIADGNRDTCSRIKPGSQRTGIER